MPDRIGENLARAFAAESRAAARTEAFALKAEREGYPRVAQLFRAVSEAKKVHSRRFRLLMRGKIGTTEENLKAAYREEVGLREDEYPKMIEEAAQGSTAVKKAFSQSMKTDSEHGELYKKALEEISAARDGTYYVCQICGHISEGFVPDNCPVCRAVKGRYKKME